MDQIAELAERAIAVAKSVMEKDPSRLSVAIDYLVTVADELRKIAPEHPALSRIEMYVKVAIDFGQRLA